MSDFEEPLSADLLSAEGIERREQILRLAKRVARSRRTKRRALRAAPVVMIAIAVGFLIRFHTSRPTAPPLVVVAPPDAIHSDLPTIDRIATDPTIADRLSIPPRAPSWQRINDDELLQSLASAGEPAGLIHMDGATFLLTDTLAQP